MNFFIKNFILIIFILLSGTIFISNAQNVTILKVHQVDQQVHVIYDLIGRKQIFKVDLFYSIDDGKNWKGPLKGVTGDVGTNITPGINKKITWDVLSEPQIEEGYMQFKVIVEPIEIPQMPKKDIEIAKQDINVNKYQNGKLISLSIALASAGTGVYTYLQSNKLYDNYKTATDNAGDLHSKVKMYDMIYPIAFAVASASTVSFVICALKQGKAKKELTFQPIPLHDGGGMAISLKF